MQRQRAPARGDGGVALASRDVVLTPRTRRRRLNDTDAGIERHVQVT